MVNIYKEIVHIIQFAQKNKTEISSDILNSTKIKLDLFGKCQHM